MILEMYKITRTKVKLGEIETGYFEILVGIIQGSVLGPMLFNLFINDLLTEIKRNCTGVNFGSMIALMALFFADDIALLSNSEEDLRRMLKICGNYARTWRFEFGLNKCGVMVFNGNDPKDWQLAPGQPIPSVDTYTYLGININQEFDISEQISEMMKEANKKIGGMKKWASEKSTVTPHIAINYFLNMIARPGTEYGAQVFNLSEKILEELEKWQNKNLKKSA